MRVTLPEKSEALVFTSPITKTVNGVSGQRYQAMPLRMAVDVIPEDKAAFLASGDAREVTSHDHQTMVGYEARR